MRQVNWGELGELLRGDGADRGIARMKVLEVSPVTREEAREGAFAIARELHLPVEALAERLRMFTRSQLEGALAVLEFCDACREEDGDGDIDDDIFLLDTADAVAKEIVERELALGLS